MANDEPFCVAAYGANGGAEGGHSFSITQITINAGEHVLMRRFHKAGDEKRSLVIVPREEYGAWLECGDPETARLMLTL